MRDNWVSRFLTHLPSWASESSAQLASESWASEKKKPINIEPCAVGDDLYYCHYLL